MAEIKIGETWCKKGLFTSYTKTQKFHEGNESLWEKKKLWGLKVHDGLKLHLWRIANDSLPLSHIDGRECPLCDIGVGNYEHLSGYCWRESNWKIVYGIPPIHFSCLWKERTVPLCPNKRKILHESLALVDKTFVECKAVVHFDKNTSPADQSCSLHIEDFTSRPGSSPSAEPSMEDNGLPVLVHTDAAWKQNKSSIAGVAVADADTDAQLAWSNRCNAQSPAQAELLALLAAAEIARQQNWSNVIFHSDAKEIVQITNKKQSPPWEFKNVLSNFFCVVDLLNSWACNWVS